MFLYLFIKYSVIQGLVYLFISFYYYYSFSPLQRLSVCKQFQLPSQISVPPPRRVSRVLVQTLAQKWAGRHGETRKQVRGGPGCSSSLVRWPVLSGDNHEGIRRRLKAFKTNAVTKGIKEIRLQDVLIFWKCHGNSNSNASSHHYFPLL